MLRLFEQRRSVRKYLEQAIEVDKIDKVISAALLAPSSRGKQPWSFIVVDDQDLLDKLSKAKTNGADFVKEAPLAILVIADTDVSDVCIEDTSIAMAYMQLQAERLGLGSCWVQLRLRGTEDGQSSQAYVRDMFDIPEHYLVEALLTVGYKGEEKNNRSHEDIECSKVHYNSFSMPYPGSFK